MATDLTLEELARHTGEQPEDLVRLLQRMAAAVDAGFPHDALIQMVKVYADTLGRAAEAEGRQEAGLVASPDVTGQIDATIVFVDLARFTSLTAAMGRPLGRHGPRPVLRPGPPRGQPARRPGRQADR